MSTLGRAITSNFVVWFVLLAILFIDVFVLYLLQETVRRKKGDLITLTQIDPLDQASRCTEEMLRQMDIQRVPEGLTPEEIYQRAEDSITDEVRAIAKDFLEQDNMFLRFEFDPVVDPVEKRPANKPILVYEIPDKINMLNTYRNCLFTRDFTQYKIFRRDPGLFYVYNAAPRSVVEIEELIARYRFYAALFVLFSLVVVLMMLRKIVLPLQRVSRCLGTMSEDFIPLIENEGSVVEQAYNRVARNARLTQLGVLLNEIVSDTSEEMLRGEDPVIASAEKVPRIICDYMNFSRVILFQREETSGTWEWGFGFDVERGELRPDDRFADSVDLELLARRRSGILVPTADLGLNEEENPSGRYEQCALVPIFHNEKPICFAALWPAKAETGAKELLHTAENVRGEIEEIFLKVISRRSLLDQEKDEVSVHLSTNLGHDLTNIIATSKWDLETLRKGLDMGIVQVQGNEIQKMRVEEAVQGLLSNTRMLQEVVNIYRAFGFANRPTFERVNMHELVENLAQLFTLSTSKSVHIDLDLQAQEPNWVVEPRMIKLVLFNLLSNAVHAISKQQEKNSSVSGRLMIATRTTEEGWFSMAVLDSGTGLRNEEGKPMNRSELRRIFRYGFTTKRDEARGGLGLSWVWTIVTKFHDGQIIPSNRPEGGAKMDVLIPPLDHKLAGQSPREMSDMPMM